MQLLSEAAKQYVAPKTHNITELDKVPLHIPIITEKRKNEVNEVYEVNLIIVNDLEYRVPNPVLEMIKELLELRPDAEFVKVTKTGVDRQTRYQVKMLPIVETKPNPEDAPKVEDAGKV